MPWNSSTSITDQEITCAIRYVKFLKRLAAISSALYPESFLLPLTFPKQEAVAEAERLCCNWRNCKIINSIGILLKIIEILSTHKTRNQFNRAIGILYTSYRGQEWSLSRNNVLYLWNYPSKQTCRSKGINHIGNQKQTDYKLI